MKKRVPGGAPSDQSLCQSCLGLGGLYCFFLICLDCRPQFQDRCVGHPVALKPYGGEGSALPAPPLCPLRSGHQLQPVRLPAQSPDPPRKLDGGARLAWWGRGLLLKGAVRGCPRAPRLLPFCRVRRGQGEEPLMPELSVECGKATWCFVTSQTSRAQKRQRQVSVEGRREVGVLGWEGSGSGRARRGFGESSQERAPAAVPFA